MARLRLLGEVMLTNIGGQDATPRSVKGRALLAYLALAPKGRVDRGKIAGLLWSESSDAKASLRQCVRELREAADAASLDIFTADMHSLTLDLKALWVDALEIERLAANADVADPERMSALYAGELLEGLEVRDPEFEAWLGVKRSYLREQACRWLERALQRGLDTNDFVVLRRAAYALLALDPAHEEAHRALIRHHALRGDPAAAVRQYLDCRQALARELDLTPSAETEALLKQIRSSTFCGAPNISPVLSVATQGGLGPLRASLSVEQRSLAAADPCEAEVLAALAAGLREALSRKGRLSIMAALPRAISADGKAQTPDELCYRVELSMLSRAERMRFCAELAETGSGKVLWAEHHDRAFGSDIFALVDDIASKLARRVDQEVGLAEILRASRRPVESLSAYDCVLRAIPLIFKLTPDSFNEAERLLRTAGEADPYDPLVYVWRAFWYSFDIGQGWERELDAAKKELSFLIRRAIELDPRSPLALAVAGHIASFVNHDYGQALDLFERSLQLDPDSAYARDLNAVTLCYTGRAEEALRELERCRDLWQRHPDLFCFQTTACIALLLAGRFDEASAVGLKTVRDNPNYLAAYRPLIASLGHLGRIEEARKHLADLHQLQPDFSIDWFQANYPPLPADCRERYIKGLRKAGVRE
jgi:DNA-binding SARP family transcriptional activator